MTKATSRGWYKSSRSNPNGECVEINLDIPDIARILDSKNPHAGILTIPVTCWTAILEALR
ncbi:MAG: DUF397 domain-containing protein [Candidatus Dormibacteraceae bacterium]